MRKNQGEDHMRRNTEKKQRRIYKVGFPILVVMLVLVSCASVETVDTDGVTTEMQVVVETVVVEAETAKQAETETMLSTESVEPTEFAEEVSNEVKENPKEEQLTDSQRNAINMLNYITVLTQQINKSKGSRIYLNSVQSSLLNNMSNNAVDSTSQRQINNLWETIDEYRMIDVKRERLDYIYEQNKAQALRKAIPNPLGLLSVVQAKDFWEVATSVLYMAVDSVSSYQSETTQVDLKYLQDNWEFDDKEQSELSESQINLWNYMTNMARDNGLPDSYVLTYDLVEQFADRSGDSNLVSRIKWLQSNEETYQYFPTYWLILAKSYYEYEEYENCLMCVAKYEEVATHIFRKDYDFAEVLPMAIVSAKKTMEQKEYNQYAEYYLDVILDNTDNDDWALRYFVVQIYLDLFADTTKEEYIKSAYDVAYKNVNELVKNQQDLNRVYLTTVDKKEVDKNTTKREKQEIKEYNTLLEESRKTELPPINEAFFLNCDMLFALADEINISDKERMEIDAIIHENGEPIFLTKVLDNKYWASKKFEEIDTAAIDIQFDGEELVLPAICMTARAKIIVRIDDNIELNDWIVKEVKRPKENTNDCRDFSVILTSELSKEYKYSAGEKVTIIVIPIDDSPNETIEFNYDVIEKKILGVFGDVGFERIDK